MIEECIRQGRHQRYLSLAYFFGACVWLAGGFVLHPSQTLFALIWFAAGVVHWLFARRWRRSQREWELLEQRFGCRCWDL